MTGGDHVMIHRFDHARGAKSWRRNDPHPAFSPDGKRIYFNVGATDWTSLHVAESAAPAT
jgi:Tol biopolymer transport system component